MVFTPVPGRTLPRTALPHYRLPFLPRRHSSCWFNSKFCEHSAPLHLRLSPDMILPHAVTSSGQFVLTFCQDPTWRTPPVRPHSLCPPTTWRLDRIFTCTPHTPHALFTGWWLNARPLPYDDTGGSFPHRDRFRSLLLAACAALPLTPPTCYQHSAARTSHSVCLFVVVWPFSPRF